MGVLDKRVAVVTGGGRGIGRAIARRFAEEGATVVISSRTQAEIDAVLAEIRAGGGEGVAVVADATQRSSAAVPVEQAISRFGRCDILVNNVGGVSGYHNSFGGGDPDSFEATMTLNLTSAWWATAAAMPGMRDRGFGRIISIGSTESLRANKNCPPAYIVAKHALVGMTRQLAEDTGDAGITVNCICPGWTNTSMVDFERLGRNRGMTGEQAHAYAARQSALNVILEPEEIAATACFLASPEGRRITGQTISVDAGYKL